jgi:hypothetical protein
MGKLTKRLVAVLTLIALGGCATLPSGPSVMVLPAPGKPMEVFQDDDLICRQWADRQIGANRQDAMNQNVATGAVVGTLLGAGLGAAIGAAAGNAGAGAAIGAGTGLIAGTTSGVEAGQVYGYEAQRRYDNAYVQCMYARGNQVPGTRRSYRPSRVPPPPPDYAPSQPYDTSPPPDTGY